MGHIMAARARRARSRQLFRKHLDVEMEKLQLERERFECAVNEGMAVRVGTLARADADSVDFWAKATLDEGSILMLSKTTFMDAVSATVRCLTDRLARTVAEHAFNNPGERR